MKMNRIVPLVSFLCLLLAFSGCDISDSSVISKGMTNDIETKGKIVSEDSFYNDEDIDHLINYKPVIGNDEFDEYINSTIAIKDREKIDKVEWVERGVCCRVSVVNSENLYERDYIFIKDGSMMWFEFSTDKYWEENLMGMGDRLLSLYSINVSYEDVTFDNKKDIIARIGEDGDSEIIELYIYSDGEYIWSDSFAANRIRDFSVNDVEKVIVDQNGNKYIYAGTGEFQPVVNKTIEDSDFEKYVSDKIEVRDGEELAESKWVVDGIIYRVTINQTVDSNKYAHLRDYFFINGEEKSWFEVSYAVGSGQSSEDRFVGSNCDFFAEYRDISFDGNKDIVISLGSWGFVNRNCAYVYSDGEYEYCKNFEKLSNYILNYKEKCLEGWSEDGLYTIRYKAVFDGGSLLVESSLSELY